MHERDRPVVEKAKARLMSRGFSELEAHRLIQRLAMNRRVALRVIAEAILAE